MYGSRPPLNALPTRATIQATSNVVEVMWWFSHVLLLRDLERQLWSPFPRRQALQLRIFQTWMTAGRFTHFRKVSGRGSPQRR